MDERIAASEKSQRRSVSAASASNSTESLIHINSVVIDLTGVMEETEPPVQEHSRICEYVAGMRERSRNTCLPFVNSEGNTMEYLPPLHVPRYRCCESVVYSPDMANARTQEPMIVTTRTSDVGTSTFNNMNGERDGLLLSSKENKGQKHWWRDSGGEHDNFPTSSFMGKASPYHAEGHKSTTCSGDKNDSSDSNSSAEVADAARILMSFSCTFDEPHNASSRNDDTESALSPERKPKMRSLAVIIEETRNTEAEGILPTRRKVGAHADVERGVRSLSKRQRSALDEGRGGPLGKRSRRGVELGPQRIHTKRVESSTPKLKGKASTRVNSLVGPKSDKIKPRKRKDLAIGKKMKELPKMNNTNKRKHVVPSEGCFDNERDGPSVTLGAMEPYFSKGKWPEDSVDDDQSMLPPPPNKSFGGDYRNSDGQLSSLGQSRNIPDLNEMFIPEADTEIENQLPILSEQNFSLNTTLGGSASCSREAVKEGKKPMSVPDQPHNITGPSMLNFPQPSIKSTSGITIANRDVGITQQERSPINFPVIEDGAVRSSSTNPFVGTWDPYNTKTIPAMQLLSLMDRGIVSGSSFNVDPPKSFLSNPFSQPNLHSRLNRKESDKFGLFFAHNRNSNGFSRLGLDAYFDGESSQKASSRIQGQMHSDIGKSKITQLEDPSDLVTQPEDSHITLGECTLNCNPADFSVPDASNEYTISANDLERKEREDNPGSENLDDREK